MRRLPQIVLIVSTLLGCWLGMQAMHELGHVLGAWSTGGKVQQVVLHPLTISRTDLSFNPRPLWTAWAGPLFGATAPAAMWGLAAVARMPAAFLLRFFAGFCLLANGLYIGLGSWQQIGDGGDLLRHGAAAWQLWLFGIVAAPAGLALWHGQGQHFGLGAAEGRVSRRAVWGALSACLALLALAWSIGGK